MILVNATFDIQASQRENFLRDIQVLIDSSKQEAGCVGYDLYESTSVENRFVMIENWEDQAALEQHNQNPVLINFAQNVANYVSAKPVVQVAAIN
ncbi:putative quinol monooxygenase [Exiguobacterium sp. s57]|uniref:putative quinol monooxygenase n=1 Tax=Exiguobacterium sp. s57 TaxID=2751258 RepID=UPI001BEBD46D|nr:putative quinol monooxygenase [Exiguobacterium sp. s57]